MEVAMYDYAHYNETILGNESIIISQSIASSPLHQHPAGWAKFRKRFPVFAYDDFSDVESLLDSQEVDVLYTTKTGLRDGKVSTARRTVVHVVFQALEPHGDVYAYISEWLSEFASNKEYGFVPYMVTLPENDRTYRETLKIPDDARVFGQHGGANTFDLEFVHHTIYDVAKMRPDTFFLFLNTQKFCEDLPNIIHLPATSDPQEKTQFINSCDAMIHARQQGESFGLACGEFSIKNKPVITFNGGVDQAHLHMLGDTGIYYEHRYDLLTILNSFIPEPDKDWDVYSKRFSPTSVMGKFKSVFFDENR